MNARHVLCVLALSFGCFGDLPVAEEIATQQENLIINQVDGEDDRWSDVQKRNLTYCVSTDFGDFYPGVVASMMVASQDWEEAADINFIHKPTEDESCTRDNDQVVFDVQPTLSFRYYCRAFFPSTPREDRNLDINVLIFATNRSLIGSLRHELGHVLGFRHEHIRPAIDGETICPEDTDWRPITSYDSGSVMHYPRCGGSSSSYHLTESDKAGVAKIYGSPR